MYEIVFNTAGTYRLTAKLNLFLNGGVTLASYTPAIICAQFYLTRNNSSSFIGVPAFSNKIYHWNLAGSIDIDIIVEIQQNDIISMLTARSGIDARTNQSAWLDSNGNDVYESHGFRQKIVGAQANQSQLIIQKL